MKIVFFIHSLSMGGAQRVTTLLANHWAEQGRDVVVVTMASPSAQEYTLDPAVRRISLNLATESAGLGNGLWNNTRRIVAMRRVLRAERPDVAIGMMATTSALLALAGIGLPSVKIGAERTYPPKLPLGAVWETLRCFAYGWLDCVVAQTEDAALWLRQHTRARKVAVIPNPLSLPLPVRPASPSPTQVLGDGAPNILLCVGRLVAEKRFDVAISVFAQLAAHHPDWKLVILGEGPLRAELEAQANALGLADRFYLPGAAGNLADWYQTADLYLLTSEFEGFPNTLLEAMGHGRAALAVDCRTGPREIIEDGITGVLTPRDDIDALRSALDRCMTDDALRARIAENALAVRERFSLNRIAAKWEAQFSRKGAA